MFEAMSTALIILADGFEEMEAIAPLDLLHRAGVEVTVAGLSQREVVGSKGLRVTADSVFADEQAKTFECVILPGGPGHTALRAHADLRVFLQRHNAAEKLLAAICAAPTILYEAKLLPLTGYTGHASIAAEIGPLEDQPVVESGRIITARGAGTATRFALTLVARMKGQETADKIAAAIHF